MAKFNLVKEDLNELSSDLVEHLLTRFPALTVPEMNEDVLHDQIMEVLEKFFEYPDYGNYN